jgi:hypothetical protein
VLSINWMRVRMGKGDLLSSSSLGANSQSGTPSSDAVPNTTVRSRHLSNGVPATPPPSNLPDSIAFRYITDSRSPDVKYRTPNGINSQGHEQLLAQATKYSARKVKEKEQELVALRCRNYFVLSIMLLANLINYMDRYTIAGLLSVLLSWLWYNIHNSPSHASDLLAMHSAL